VWSKLSSIELSHTFNEVVLARRGKFCVSRAVHDRTTAVMIDCTPILGLESELLMTRPFFPFLVLVICACDAQDMAAAKNAAAAKNDKAAVTPEHGANSVAPPTADAPPAKFASLSACLETCEAPGMIETNRATCKLNCDGSYGAQPSPAGTVDADPVGTAATCMGRCYSAGSAPEACASDCKKRASEASSAPAAGELDTLDTCVRTCHADKSVRPTNQATCELNCTQAARVAGPAPTAR